MQKDKTRYRIVFYLFPTNVLRLLPKILEIRDWKNFSVKKFRFPFQFFFFLNLRSYFTSMTKKNRTVLNDLESDTFRSVRPSYALFLFNLHLSGGHLMMSLIKLLRLNENSSPRRKYLFEDFPLLERIGFTT